MSDETIATLATIGISIIGIGAVAILSIAERSKNGRLYTYKNGRIYNAWIDATTRANHLKTNDVLIERVHRVIAKMTDDIRARIKTCSDKDIDEYEMRLDTFLDDIECLGSDMTSILCIIRFEEERIDTQAKIRNLESTNDKLRKELQHTKIALQTVK